MKPPRRTADRGLPGPTFVALVLSLCYSCALFQRQAFQSVGPLLAPELGLDSASLADLGATFFWVYLALMIPSGILVDMQGPRRMAIVSALLSSAGCALFAVARGLPELMLARATISAGGAFAFICMLRFIASAFPTRKATIAGRGILIGNLGAISAGVPLTLLLAHLHWREVWAVIAVGWLVLAAVLWRRVPPDRAETLGSVRLAVVAAELRAIFGAASTYLGIALIAGLAGAYWAFANFVGPRVLALGPVSPIEVSMALTVLTCGYATGAACWGWLGDRAQREVLIALACAATGTAWLAFTTFGALSLTTAALLLFAAGFGAGAFGLVYVVLTERHPARQSALVIACVNCGIPFGAALFQAIAGRLDGYGMIAPILTGSVIAMVAALALFAEGRASLGKLAKARP